MTGPCFSCRRAAIPGLAYKNRPACAVCAPHAPGAEMMMSFSETETEAIDAGGGAAGAYLDELGKTDLATLTEAEWRQFLAMFLDGYSAAMRAEAKAAPPF